MEKTLPAHYSAHYFYLFLYLPYIRTDCLGQWLLPRLETGFVAGIGHHFSQLSKIMHFAVIPNADGTLNASSNSLDSANCDSILIAAASAGKKVLLVVGGADVNNPNYPIANAFYNLTTAANVAGFVHNIINFMKKYGHGTTDQPVQYSGCDIDWEDFNHISGVDPAILKERYERFVDALRDSLNGRTWPGGTRRLLTVTAQPTTDTGYIRMYNRFLTQVRTPDQTLAKVDEFNLMTYDLANSPSSSWKVWHNSAIYDKSWPYQQGGSLRSVNDCIQPFFGQVPISHVSIGQPFNGYLWSNADTLGQSWVVGMTTTQCSYTWIMQNKYNPANYRWYSGTDPSKDDKGAVLQHLSNNTQFVSYDNQRSIYEHLKYVRNNGLGGVIIWELSQGYRTDLSTQSARDSLLKTVGSVAFGPSVGGTHTIALTSPLSRTYIGSSTTSYLFTWKPTIGADTYVLHVVATNPSGWSSTATVYDTTLSATSLSATINSLPTNTDFEWYVVASNSGGSVTSPTSSFSTKTSLSGIQTVNGTWYVLAGVTLTFQPGTTVRMGSNAQISVYGALTANGTSANHIRFQSLDGTTPWGSVLARNATGTTTFSFCDFSTCGNYAVYASNSIVTVTNCTFTNCFVAVGFNPSLNGSRIANNRINGSGWGAIVEQAGSNAPISQDTISSNVRGVWLSGASPSMTQNTISNNTNAGLSCYSAASPLLAPNGTNKILNNANYQVFAQTASPMLGSATSQGQNCIYGSIPIVSAINSSSISARYNYWGSDPSPSGAFSVDGTSTIDHGNELLSCPVSLSPFSAQSGAGSYESGALESARTSRMVKNWKEAIARYAHFIRSYPNSPFAKIALWELRWTYREYAGAHDNPVQSRIIIMELERFLASFDGLGRRNGLAQTATAALANEYMLGGNGAKAEQIYGGLLEESLYSELLLTVLSDLFTLKVLGQDDLVAGTSLLRRMETEFPNSDQTQLAGLVMPMVSRGNELDLEMPGRAASGLNRPTPRVSETLPLSFSLEQNYPNPFNPETKIQYAVPEPAHVRLTIYNLLGQEVQVLVDEMQNEPGYRTIRFDGTGLASGIYFYKLDAGKFSQVKKLLLMK